MTEAEEAAGSPRPVAAGEPEPAPLPAAVRARVVSFTADCLGRLPGEKVPGPLKRVASFAPARRTRLAGGQIATALDLDEGFRGLVAAQARDLFPELVGSLERGEVPGTADPVEVAALAYLVRAPRWRELVGTVAELVEVDQGAAAVRQAQEQSERLRRQLEALNEDLKEARQKGRDQTAALKAENAELRHKLGDARARARAAEAAREAAELRAAESAAAASTAGAAAEAETRRLRVRLEELERELNALRRSERSERGTETLRARLLLDSLLDAAQGLRRELALPAVGGAPADLVEAHEAEHGSRTPTGHASMAVDDPALLDQLLALPRAHMIVDGYNVTKTAWPDLPLEKQRDRLLAGIAPLVARSGAEVTVVFDAAESRERPVVHKPRGVRVLFSREGVIADDLIRELVGVEPRGRAVVVVTSDRAVATDVSKAGFRVVGAAALARLLSRA